MKLVALVNDTTGALIASAYNDPDTIIGAIFGTGCNAAYMEKAKRIPKLGKHGEADGTSTGGGGDESLMAINCEYGAFDNSHSILPRTTYDEIIDKESPRPGEQTFEKMSAGLYLGEIFRQVLVELTGRGVIFNRGENTGSTAKRRAESQEKQGTSLDTPYAIDTEFLSKIENDDSPGLASSKSLLESELYLPSSHLSSAAPLSPSPDELVFLRHLAQLIAIRGARLCACGVSAICTRLGVTSGHVAADGSVAIKHPHFRKRWEGAVAEILGCEEGEIQLTSAEDGSGIGAAVIVALSQGHSQG